MYYGMDRYRSSKYHPISVLTLKKIRRQFQTEKMRVFSLIQTSESTVRNQCYVIFALFGLLLRVSLTQLISEFNSNSDFAMHETMRVLSKACIMYSVLIGFDCS